jgi:hypothetical protein
MTSFSDLESDSLSESTLHYEQTPTFRARGAAGKEERNKAMRMSNDCKTKVKNLSVYMLTIALAFGRRLCCGV